MGTRVISRRYKKATDQSKRLEPTVQRTIGMDVALVSVLVDVSGVGNVAYVKGSCRCCFCFDLYC